MIRPKNNSSQNSDASLPLIIVNPKSASGATRDNWAVTVADLRAHFGPFNVAFTKSAGDGIALAKRSVESGRKFIIACGGDGTINEVANGILQAGEDVEFGVLPSGTGGDFRRTIGMPANVRDAAKALRDGVTRWIDVGKVSFFDHNDQPTSRYFLNVSSFGLSASIGDRVKKQKLLNWLPANAVRGKANFAISTLQEVLESNFVTVRVKIDEKDEKTLNTINFAVANSRFFGGGMKIAPDAKINDGFLDIINIGDIKTLKILMNAYKLYGGSHLALKEVKSTVAKRVEVSAFDAKEIFLETDGELPGKLPAVYEIVPNALRIRVPKHKASLNNLKIEDTMKLIFYSLAILVLFTGTCTTNEPTAKGNSNNMLKLYKRFDNQLHYWETWEKDEKTAIIHWGLVGLRGQDKEIKGGLFSSFRKTVQKEIEDKLNEGYIEFDEEKNWSY